VIKQGTLRELGSLLVQYKWKISHLDIKTMLLNGKWKEKVYIFQPKGFKVLGQEEKICKLFKAWFGNLYYMHEEGKVVILVIYADDFLLIQNYSKRMFMGHCITH
jgi:hypothetical protein